MRVSLRDALMSAFPDPDELDMLLWARLDKRLVQLVPKSATYTIQCFRLIEKADAEGWTGELILAACAERPGNALLAAVAEPLSLVPSIASGFEQMISMQAGIHDVASWRAEMWRTEARVCRIESPISAGTQSRGTGFLVGPDLVLTNWHVVRHLESGGDPKLTRVRFDHKLDDEGRQISAGTLYGLAERWLVSASPPSSIDATGGNGLPSTDELDYALLRLRGAVGDAPAGPVAGAGSLHPRGWIELRDPAPDLVPGDAAIIVQHPLARPLALAIGSVVDVNANGTRVRYRTNTEEGSSGSPCFTGGWELAALHQGNGPAQPKPGDVLHNRGIPVSAILARLTDAGLADELPGGPE